MDRRSFLNGSTAFLALTFALDGPGASGARAADGAGSPAFSADQVVEEARRLAAAPYQPASTELPDGYGDLSYDQYRDIWFKPEASLWADQPTPFRIDLLHRGFIFKEPVKIAVVESGAVRPIPFASSLFGYGHLVTPPADGADLDFSGFRARAQINTPGSWQEFLVFQGASYFRAVARDQLYGLSARGLAINTGGPEGEEFPAFRKFWIEQAGVAEPALVVHALLDSLSVTGAYRFEITPGAETIIDVNATIFPRTEIQKLGIAPLTSMFMFNGIERSGFDDFRRAVHDSDGLQMLTGSGEWIWRPLANPGELQISSFADARPRGFGLMQRAREYEDFLDLEAGYERRPSLWIEPLGDWAEGAVELVEIPTDREINDNIVAYWRPSGPVPAGGPWRFAYRMRWTNSVRPQSELLSVASSSSGLTLDGQRRIFVVDFSAAADAPDRLLTDVLAAEITASVGQVVNAIIHDRRRQGTIRVSFELDAGSEELSELRLRLTAAGEAASETWLYRWTRA